MAPPVEKKKKFSSDNRRPISSSTTIGEHEQQKALGKRRPLFRLAKKMNNRIFRKIWICADIWMDTFPFFDHAELGLKLALLSPRFDALVDKHFGGKTEITIWTRVELRKDRGHESKLRVFSNYANSMHLPLPDHPLPDKIRFRFLRIEYIDHSVIAFLRSNKQILFGRGINLQLSWPPKMNVQPILDVLAREIWPLFAPNIRHLGIYDGDQLDNLRSHTSPTILVDLNINSITAHRLLPAAVLGGDFDGPNATTAGQALCKWLHTPRKDGQQPKRLFGYWRSINFDWVNDFKEAFLGATSAACCYIIQFTVFTSMPIEPFELVNNGTNEKLTLIKETKWLLLKRCQIGQMVQWEDEKTDNLNGVSIDFWSHKKCIGRLSPPPPAGQSGGKGRRTVRK